MKFKLEVTMTSGDTFISIELDDMDKNHNRILSSTSHLNDIKVLSLELSDRSVVHIRGSLIESVVVTMVSEF